MTIKLLKYELRSSAVLMGIVWAATILTSIMTTLFTGSMLNSDSALVQLLGGLPVFLFAVACVAMAVGMVFIIVIRFYQSLLGDEGYLMHTLPVKEWQHITAKGLSATIYTLGCAVVLFIAVAIFSKGAIIVEVAKVFPTLAKHPVYILYAIEAFIVGIFGILKSVYSVYASMAVGQLADKHRILLSVAAYIGLGFVISVGATVFILLGVNLTDKVAFFNPLTQMINFGSIQFLIISAFLIELAQVALFHVITERILTKSLNLL